MSYSLPTVLVVLTLTPLTFAQTPALDHFEKHVRPLLDAQCLRCHGPAKSQGGLRVDSAAALTTGGDTGPAINVQKPTESLLLKAIRHDGELKMPPKGKLAPAEVAMLEQWAANGFPWPSAKPAATSTTAKPLWSLAPVTQPALPTIRQTDWPRQPLDHFILARLEARGLKPAPLAERATLLRRLTFDLTGLPPTLAETDAFLADRAPDALAKVVDRLLASPAYGERWGRHWLDLVRYCDSFDARGLGGEMDCAEAWRYRDWVVRALNADMPYDQFVRWQIAGDVLPNSGTDGKIATAMLALGNWGGGDADKDKLLTDIVDDQIDVVSRSILGLTVSCARCHDHKFDPISTKDYYALAGIFFSSHILPNVGPKTNGPPLLRIPLSDPTPRSQAQAQLVRAEAAVRTLESQARSGSNATGTILAQHTAKAAGREGLHAWRGAADCPNAIANYTPTRQAFSTIVLPPRTLAVHPGPTVDVAIVWTSPIAGDIELTGRVFDCDSTCGDGVTWTLMSDRGPHASGSVTNAGTSPIAPTRITVRVGERVRLVIQRRGEYTCDTTGIDWRIRSGTQTWDMTADWLAASAPATAQLGPWAIEDCSAPALNEAILPAAERTELVRLRTEVARLKKELATPVVATHGALEGGVPGSPHAGMHDVRVHIRGRYDRLGDLVPRGFPTAISVQQPPQIRTGSGRQELADWLTRPDHPLTARVIVNRLWQHHFGRGLVPTPSNFGHLGTPPTHPELLDHLATQFMADGWSLKRLHRSIVLSATYQQSAQADPATRTADVDNLLWGRYPRRRLEAEAIRDSWLAVAGKLPTNERGGPASRDFNVARRTLYTMTIRSDRTGFGPLFDAADPTAPVDVRTVSTVAPQALFAMNHPFVQAQAQAFAQRVLGQPGGVAERLEFAHRLAFARKPSVAEVNLGREFIARANNESAGWTAWCHLLVQANEFITIE